MVVSELDGTSAVALLVKRKWLGHPDTLRDFLVTQLAGRKRSPFAHGRRTQARTARPPCAPSRPSFRARPGACARPSGWLHRSGCHRPI